MVQAPSRSYDTNGLHCVQVCIELVKSCVAPVIMQRHPVAVRPGTRGYVLHGDILYNHLRTVNCNMLPDSSKQARSMTCREGAPRCGFTAGSLSTVVAGTRRTLCRTVNVETISRREYHGGAQRDATHHLHALDRQQRPLVRPGPPVERLPVRGCAHLPRMREEDPDRVERDGEEVAEEQEWGLRDARRASRVE